MAKKNGAGKPKGKGFGALTAEERAELGRRGGEAAAENGNAHRWTSEEASAACNARWERARRAGKAKPKKRARAESS